MIACSMLMMRRPVLLSHFGVIISFTFQQPRSQIIPNIGVLLRLSQHYRDGAHRAPDVFIARLPVADTYPHRPHATPGSRREERFAGCRDGGDYVIGPLVVVRAMRIEKAHQSLVNRRAPKHFGTR